MFEELKKSVSEIKMSDETKEEIIKNCYSKTQKGEEYIMKNNVFKLRKVLTIAAAIMAVCVISAGAVITYVRGFKDVTKNGAVIGTEFNEEPEMINVDAKVKGEKLLVSVSVVDYNNVPYSEAEDFRIANYEIVDENGNIIEKNKSTLDSENRFEEGKAYFEIPIDTIRAGKYALVINGFELSKKADQPLHISGRWACEFSK